MQSHGRRQSSASHGDEMRCFRLHAQRPTRLVHLETGARYARHACKTKAFVIKCAVELSGELAERLARRDGKRNVTIQFRQFPRTIRGNAISHYSCVMN